MRPRPRFWQDANEVGALQTQDAGTLRRRWAGRFSGEERGVLTATRPIRRQLPSNDERLRQVIRTANCRSVRAGPVVRIDGLRAGAIVAGRRRWVVGQIRHCQWVGTTIVVRWRSEIGLPQHHAGAATEYQQQDQEQRHQDAARLPGKLAPHHRTQDRLSVEVDFRLDFSGWPQFRRRYRAFSETACFVADNLIIIK